MAYRRRSTLGMTFRWGGYPGDDLQVGERASLGMPFRLGYPGYVHLIGPTKRKAHLGKVPPRERPSKVKYSLGNVPPKVGFAEGGPPRVVLPTDSVTDGSIPRVGFSQGGPFSDFVLCQW